MTPKSLTDIFREALRQQGLARGGIELYTWDDEPLFDGKSLAGDMIPMETRAVDAVHLYVKLNGTGANT